MTSALARGANEATLEVRPTNIPARKAYEKFGFKVVGTRPRYYTDNNEDALIMTTAPLGSQPMRERLARLRDEIAARLPIELGEDGLPKQAGRGAGLARTDTGEPAPAIAEAGHEAGAGAEVAAGDGPGLSGREGSRGGRIEPGDLILAVESSRRDRDRGRRGRPADPLERRREPGLHACRRWRNRA